MNGTAQGLAAERARGSAQSLLIRGQAFRTRALPPLDQIRRAVAQILKRWPDAIPAPEERDREKLARDMLRRITDWDWDKITTVQVLSAAVAVFDETRRTRQDLGPVREFYVSELASCEPGAFLDAMVGLYLDSFAPGADHTRHLADALSRRSGDIGGRHRKLISAMPEIFRPDAAPLALARMMREADDAYQELKSIGLNSPHATGLAQTAQPIFFDRLAPDLTEAESRRKLFNWLTPENGPVLQAGAARAVEALLAPWRVRTPPDDLRNELSEAIIAAWNDPRLHAGGIWSGFDPELRAVLLRWLTHQDMKFFCDMVTATQNNPMWPPRRNFWLKLYREGRIDQAWVAFGTEAARYAQQNLLRGGRTEMARRFGRQHDRGGSTSLLIMRIGNKIVVDGCHSYRTHIFRMDDRGAPKLYQREYYCDDIMRAARNSKSHVSIPNWSQWVLQHV